MSSLPADACPYPRPFPAGFSGCPAYDPQMYVGLTSSNRPLPAIRTCSYLDMGETDRGRYYGRCLIGAAEQRVAWLSRLDAGRVAALRRFRQSLAVAVAPLTERLWEVKARQLSAHRDHDQAAQAAAAIELEEACADFMRVFDGFLDRQCDALAELGIAARDARELVRSLLDQMVVQRRADSGRFSAPPEVLARFPLEVRAIFQPYEGSSRESSAPA